MEPVDFLGGKYQQSEQILPGPMQTFRAHESSTGRPVFVHRISTTDEPFQQLSLLRLLSLALLRSPSARNLILDLSEENGFWYVITQNEHQCLLLREWLQFELDRVAGQGEGPMKREIVEPELPRRSERIEPEGVRPESARSSPATEASRPETPQQEPGEFTRFFQGGLPSAKKTMQPEPARSQERPSNPDMQRGQDRGGTRTGGFVQRPNTPVPSSSQRSNEPGEFTKIFSRPTIEAASSAPKPFPTVASDPVGRKSDLPDMFSTAPEMPTPLPSPPPEPGEYTRIFGQASVPPVPQASAVATQSTRALDDPLTRGTLGSAPASGTPASKRPSEYTRVMQGSQPRENSTADAAPSAGAPGSTASPGVSPVNVKIAPVAPLHMPSVSGQARGAGVSMSSPAGPVAMHGPSVRVPAAGAIAIPGPSPQPQGPAASSGAASDDKKKLIIFFSILGALAILLIIVSVLLLKK